MATSTVSREGQRVSKTPFEFLVGIPDDILVIVHLIIETDHMKSFHKHEMIKTALRSDDLAFAKYGEWIKKVTKIPSSELFASLPGEIQSDIQRNLDYHRFDDALRMCEGYKAEELKAWIEAVRNPTQYLDVAYDTARKQLRKLAEFSGKNEALFSSSNSSKNKPIPPPKPAKLQEAELLRAPASPIPAPRTNFRYKPKKINFLLIGETGVGKTTFINSMVNYLQNSFDDCMKQNTRPTVLVKMEYQYHDRVVDKEIKKKIRVEPDPTYQLNDGNEVFEAGHSTTQNPITYQYSWIDESQENILHIIDTPGINDTRGVDQDNKNFELIQKHIARVGEIHAVCVVMKPNENRLSRSFLYCLNGLLLHLHRNATQNILFLFTNCRSTMFKPGESLTTLQAFLDKLRKERGVYIPTDKSNMFCFDNDCIKYMMTSKILDNVRTDAKDKMYKEEWSHNSDEIKRFLYKVTETTPIAHSPEIVQTNEMIYLVCPKIAVLVKELEEKKMKLEEDMSTLRRRESRGDKVKSSIAKNQRLTKSIDTEIRYLREMVVEFAVFLHHNSISALNDPFEEELHIIIENIEKKEGSSMLYYIISASLQEYQDQKSSNIEFLNSNKRNAPTAENIYHALVDLCDLEYCGKQLQQVKEECESHLKSKYSKQGKPSGKQLRKV